MKLVNLTNNTDFVENVEHVLNIDFADHYLSFFEKNRNFQVQQAYYVPIDPSRLEEILDIKSYVVLVSYRTPDNTIETKYIVLQSEDDLYWSVCSLKYSTVTFDNLNCAIYRALAVIYDIDDPDDVTEENLRRCLNNYYEIVKSL